MRGHRNIQQRLAASVGNGKQKVAGIDQAYREYVKSTGWAGTLYSLCENDITLIPEVLKTKMDLVVLFLEQRNAKRELEAKVQTLVEEHHRKQAKTKRK